eukprot:GHVO01033735.1.p1 GENE.GHVO01033735.1~~GHVO01033735.1.p1  ORF type:complete len:1125 (+),score=150.32 GHVO01033735.1:149-3376(+)
MDKVGRRTLPERYKAGVGREALRGVLMRQKGHWKYKWAKEIFVLQAACLITGSRDSPFLVKLCIPVKNIQRIEEVNDKEPCKFVIQYLAADKGGVSKVVMEHCRANNEEERSRWVNELRQRQMQAVTQHESLMDVVSRDNADATIRELHDAMRAAGIFGISTRLGNLMNSKNSANLMDAFHRIRLYTDDKKHQSVAEDFNRQISVTKREVEQTREDLKDELKLLGRDKQAQLAAQIILGLRHRKMANAFRHLARQVSKQYTATTIFGAQKVLQGSLCDQHDDYSKQVVWWRKILLTKALDYPYRRLMKDYLMSLKVGAAVKGNKRIICTQRMDSLIDIINIREREMVSRCLLRWRGESVRREKQMDAVSGLVTRWVTKSSAAALSQWRAYTFATDLRQRAGFKILRGLMLSRDKNDESVAFYKIRRWTTESELMRSCRAMELMASTNVQVLDGFNTLPRERACYLLALTLRTVRTARMRNGWNSIIHNAAHAKDRIRSALSLMAVLNGHLVARKSWAFLRISFYALKLNRYVLSRAKATLHIAYVCKVVFNRSLMRGLVALKFRNEQAMLASKYELLNAASQSSLVKMTYLLVTRLERRRLTLLSNGLQALERHNEQTTMISGLVRVHSLQRIVTLASRVDTAASSWAFHQLRVNRDLINGGLSTHQASGAYLGRSEVRTAAQDALESSCRSLNMIRERQRPNDVAGSAFMPVAGLNFSLSETKGIPDERLISLQYLRPLHEIPGTPPSKSRMRRRREVKIKKLGASSRPSILPLRTRMIRRDRRIDIPFVASDDDVWNGMSHYPSPSITSNNPNYPPLPYSPFIGLEDSSVNGRHDNWDVVTSSDGDGLPLPQDELSPVDSLDISLSLRSISNEIETLMRSYLGSNRRISMSSFPDSDYSDRPVLDFLEEETRRMLGDIRPYQEDATGEAPDMSDPTNYTSLVSQVFSRVAALNHGGVDFVGGPASTPERYHHPTELHADTPSHSTTATKTKKKKKTVKRSDHGDDPRRAYRAQISPSNYSPHPHSETGHAAYGGPNEEHVALRARIIPNDDRRVTRHHLPPTTTGYYNGRVRR